MNTGNSTPSPDRDPMLDYAIAALEAMSKSELRSFVAFQQSFFDLPKPRRVVLIMTVQPGIKLARLASLVGLVERSVQRMDEYKRLREVLNGFDSPARPTKRWGSKRATYWPPESPDQ